MRYKLCGSIYVVRSMLGELCGVSYVLQSLWCELCGVAYVVQSMWFSLCGARYVVQSMWFSLCGGSYVVHAMWCNLAPEGWRTGVHRGRGSREGGVPPGYSSYGGARSRLLARGRQSTRRGEEAGKLCSCRGGPRRSPEVPGGLQRLPEARRRAEGV